VGGRLCARKGDVSAREERPLRASKSQRTQASEFGFVGGACRRCSVGARGGGLGDHGSDGGSRLLAPRERQRAQ
jgi:hypothetical protein